MAAQEREAQASAPATEASPPPGAVPPLPPPSPGKPMSFFTNPENEPHVLLLILLIITFVLGAVLMTR